MGDQRPVFRQFLMDESHNTKHRCVYNGGISNFLPSVIDRK